jgi:hypothetical protein
MSPNFVMFGLLVLFILDLIFIVIFWGELTRIYLRLTESVYRFIERLTKPIDKLFEQDFIGPCPECQKKDVKIQSSEFLRSTHETSLFRDSDGNERTHIKHLYKDTCICLCNPAIS